MAETNLSPETRNDLGIGDITTKFKKARTFEQTIDPTIELMEKRGKAEESLLKAKHEQDIKKSQLTSEVKEKEASEFRRISEEGKAQMLDYEAFKPTKDNFVDLAGLFGLMSIMSSGSGGQGKYSAMNALGNMGAAMQGYRQGRKDLADKELKEFNANMQRVKAHNEKVMQGVKQLQELLGKDIAAYEAKKAEILAYDNNSVVAAQIARNNIQGAIDTTNELAKNIRLMQEKRMALAERAAAREAKQQSGTIKPSAAFTANYVGEAQMASDLKNLGTQLKDPKLNKLIKDNRLEAFMSEEGGKIGDQLLQTEIDPQLRRFLIAARAVRNSYYLTISGKAVTGGEAMRNYGVVPQPGDDPGVLSDKIETLTNQIRGRQAMARKVYSLPDLSNIPVSEGDFDVRQIPVDETGQGQQRNIEQDAVKKFKKYEPDVYNYGYDEQGFYREKK